MTSAGEGTRILSRVSVTTVRSEDEIDVFIVFVICKSVGLKAMGTGEVVVEEG